jgi:hypothetical protein
LTTEKQFPTFNSLIGIFLEGKFYMQSNNNIVNVESNPVSEQTVTATSVTESVEVVAETICRQLQPLWNKYNREGLEVRYTSGQILNQELGTPDKRQKKGAAVINQVAKTMKLPVSDISRMRSFASHFESFEAFQAAHADCTTWGEVRRLLPSLRSSDKPEATQKKSKAKRRIQPQQRVFVRHLAAMQRKLSRVAGSFKPDQLEAVVNAMKNVLHVLSQAGVEYKIIRHKMQITAQAA